jgi:Outer membrane protein beta-barrel domain
MKKLYFLTLSFLICTFVTAQLKEKNTIEITPKIGYSSFAEFTNLNADPNNNKSGSTGSITGFSFGVTADYYFNNRWSLRSGLLFDKMGSRTLLNGIKYEDRLNYISIPINANWHFGSTRKWNLNFGLSSSFLTDAKYSQGTFEKSFPDGLINNFQFGMSYGIGYKIEINKKFGILIESQSFTSFTNILNNSNYNATNNGGSLNIGAVIQL